MIPTNYSEINSTIPPPVTSPVMSPSRQPTMAPIMATPTMAPVSRPSYQSPMFEPSYEYRRQKKSSNMLLYVCIVVIFILLLVIAKCGKKKIENFIKKTKEKFDQFPADSLEMKAGGIGANNRMLGCSNLAAYINPYVLVDGDGINKDVCGPNLNASAMDYINARGLSDFDMTYSNSQLSSEYRDRNVRSMRLGNRTGIPEHSGAYAPVSVLNVNNFDPTNHPKKVGESFNNVNSKMLDDSLLTEEDVFHEEQRAKELGTFMVNRAHNNPETYKTKNSMTKFFSSKPELTRRHVGFDEFRNRDLAKEVYTNGWNLSETTQTPSLATQYKSDLITPNNMIKKSHLQEDPYLQWSTGNSLTPGQNVIPSVDQFEDISRHYQAMSNNVKYSSA